MRGVVDGVLQGERAAEPEREQVVRGWMGGCCGGDVFETGVGGFGERGLAKAALVVGGLGGGRMEGVEVRGERGEETEVGHEVVEEECWCCWWGSLRGCVEGMDWGAVRGF